MLGSWFLLGNDPATKLDDFFGKTPKGGGGHFQSKNLCCRFWELLTGLFEHEVDTKPIEQKSYREKKMAIYRIERLSIDRNECQ